MGGYPPEYFNIKGFQITAIRAEDRCFVHAYSYNTSLDQYITKHIKDSPKTENNREFKMILEEAVREYNSFIKK